MILDIMNIDNKYSKKLREEIDRKSNLLFEKSIDSKLKLKKIAKLNRIFITIVVEKILKI